MHSITKNKRIISNIKTKMSYERYQVDFVLLAIELNMKGKFKYLCTWVEHFSKYACVIPIKTKKQLLSEMWLLMSLLMGIQKYYKLIIKRKLSIASWSHT